MRIFYWAKSLNYHNLDTFQAVEDQLDGAVTYVVTELESRIRKQQGWQEADISNKNVILLEYPGWLTKSTRILNQNADAIHIFSGFWHERRWIILMVYSLMRGIKTAIFQEPYNTSYFGYFSDESQVVSKLKAFFRPLLYRFTTLIINIASVKKKRPCILPLSLIAYDQFVATGVDRDTLFPFGYFVNKLDIPKPEKTNECLKVIFVGTLIRRKGVDVAISAINTLADRGIKINLDIYGPGDPKLFIPEETDTIRYKGVIPSTQAQKIIANYDALLLPSRHDGWGMVVNEALMQGVPVIVSDRVGAKCLVDVSGAGIVFKSGNSQELADILETLANDSSILDKMRYFAQKAGNQILPWQGAHYLINVLRFYFEGTTEKPSAIWTR